MSSGPSHHLLSKSLTDASGANFPEKQLRSQDCERGCIGCIGQVVSQIWNSGCWVGFEKCIGQGISQIRAAVKSSPDIRGCADAYMGAGAALVVADRQAMHNFAPGLNWARGLNAVSLNDGGDCQQSEEVRGGPDWCDIANLQTCNRQRGLICFPGCTLLLLCSVEEEITPSRLDWLSIDPQIQPNRGPKLPISLLQYSIQDHCRLSRSMLKGHRLFIVEDRSNRLMSNR